MSECVLCVCVCVCVRVCVCLHVSGRQNDGDTEKKEKKGRRRRDRTRKRESKRKIDTNRERDLLQFIEFVAMSLMFFLDRRHGLLPGYACSLTLLKDFGENGIRHYGTHYYLSLCHI